MRGLWWSVPTTDGLRPLPYYWQQEISPGSGRSARRKGRRSHLSVSYVCNSLFLTCSYCFGMRLCQCCSYLSFTKGCGWSMVGKPYRRRPPSKNRMKRQQGRQNVQRYGDDKLELFALVTTAQNYCGLRVPTAIDSLHRFVLFCPLLTTGENS